MPDRPPAVLTRTVLTGAWLPAPIALALAAALLVVAPAPAEATTDWGRLGARDGVLRKGCQTLTYRYWAKPGEGDWALETFLTDRRGKRVASSVMMAGQDPVRGVDRFRICRWSTVPGRYRISGLLSVQNGPREYVEGALASVTFRLRRPR